MSKPRLFPVAAFAIAVVASLQSATAQVRPPQDASATYSGPSLVVTGHGEVSVDPDLAVAQFGATFQAPQALDAQNKVNQVLQQTIDKVKSIGIPEAQIQSARLQLDPIFNERPPRPNEPPAEPELVGYRATSSIRVQITDMGKIGSVIDAALGAGSNRFDGLSFQLKNDAGARKEALRKAADDARAKAAALADAMGVKLTSVFQVIEGSAQVNPPMPMAAQMFRAAAATPTPIQAGQVEVDATITVTYQIFPEPVPAGH